MPYDIRHAKARLPTRRAFLLFRAAACGLALLSPGRRRPL